VKQFEAHSQPMLRTTETLAKHFQLHGRHILKFGICLLRAMAGHHLDDHCQSSRYDFPCPTLDPQVATAILNSKLMLVFLFLVDGIVGGSYYSCFKWCGRTFRVYPPGT
jgi:hypothetical protein